MSVKVSLVAGGLVAQGYTSTGRAYPSQGANVRVSNAQGHVGTLSQGNTPKTDHATKYMKEIKWGETGRK